MSPSTNQTFRVSFVSTCRHEVTISAPSAQAAITFAQAVYVARGSDAFPFFEPIDADWQATLVTEEAGS